MKDQDLPGPQIFAQWLDPIFAFFYHCGFDTPHDLRRPPNFNDVLSLDLRKPDVFEPNDRWLPWTCDWRRSSPDSTRRIVLKNWRVWSMVYLVDLYIIYNFFFIYSFVYLCMVFKYLFGNWLLGYKLYVENQGISSLRMFCVIIPTLVVAQESQWNLDSISPVEGIPGM